MGLFMGKQTVLREAAELWRRRQWHPTPVLLPGKSHGQRSLVGCSPWGLEESDMTERLHFHFSLSCIGEGNGNPPLQCSCLEIPRDGGAWWAAVYGVAQSWTGLKRLSSSSSSSVYVPQLSYPFICWWTSRLLPCPGYHKQCCDEHWGTHVSFNSGFLSVYAQQFLL